MSDTTQTSPPTTAIESVFSPTSPMRRAKSQFWARITAAGMATTPPGELASVRAYTSSRQLVRWWESLQFRDWFLNNQEYSERLEATKLRALDLLDELLEERSGKTSELVSACKLAFEITGAVSKQQAKFLDKHIGEMSESELESFLASRKSHK